MAISIDILSGGNSPKTQVFDKNEITIGRGPAADVRLHPADTLCAGGVHCRLTQRNGRWYIDVEHPNGITVHSEMGEPQFLGGGQNAPLDDSTEITIGGAGPRLRIQARASHQTVQAPAKNRIEIRIVSGFNSPWRGTFGNDVIAIGRSAQADVRLHPTRDTACASGIHARLIRSSGGYAIEAVHESGLTIAGPNRVPRQLQRGDRAEIAGESDVTLNRNGPVIHLSPIPDADEDLPMTCTGQESPDYWTASAAPAAWSAAPVEEKSLIPFGLSRRSLALIGSAAALLLLLWARAGGDPPDDQRVRDALRKAQGSVYLVVALDDQGRINASHGNGTAWTVGKGLLATNAHVAELVDSIRKAGLRPVARLPGDRPHDLPIVGETIHPGWSRWSPVLSSSLITATGDEVRLSPAFDVALLRVEGNAGRPLKLAGRRQTLRLGNGQVIGYAGYPTENIIGLSDNPAITTAIGKINKLTDLLGRQTDEARRLLIQYDMVVTGGASGSPILNADGAVVGLVNAGNMVFTPTGERISVGLNIGQRVDLLKEVLDNTAKAKQAARDREFQAQLEQTMATPEDSARMLAQTLLIYMKRQEGVPPHARLSRVFTATDPLAAGGDLGNRYEIQMQSNATYILVACSADYSDVDMSLVSGSKILTNDESPSWFAILRCRAPSSGRHALKTFAHKTNTDNPLTHAAVFLVEW